jgi:hypothetical protein
MPGTAVFIYAHASANQMDGGEIIHGLEIT